MEKNKMLDQSPRKATEFQSPDNDMRGPVIVQTNPFTIDCQFKQMSVKQKEEKISAPKKKYLHSALIRNDVNIPDINAPITTKKFLLEVKSERCFMFGIQIIKKLPCPAPPPLHILNHLVIHNLDKALSKPGIVPDVEGW